MRTPTLALVLTVLALPSLAEDTKAPPVKQSPPPPGTPKPFTIPAHTDFALPNGMKVTLIPYGAVPKAAVVLALRGGNSSEAADQVWLADVTGALLTEGTATRSASQIAEQAAAMGGSIEVTSGEDRTEIDSDVLSEFAPRAVELIADVARHPAFPEDALARIRDDKARDLSIGLSMPRQMAMQKFRALMYPGHAYGRLFPTEAQLQGYTVDKVKAFYAANYGAARAHLYVSGRFDAKATEAAVRRAFADWAAGATPTFTPAQTKTERVIHLVDKPGAVQSTILVGVPVVDPSSPDYVPLLVTNTLLGGSFASRITANLREQHGYTYSPFGQVSTRWKSAYWLEQADVTTAVTGASLTEIQNEIDRLQKDAPPAAELDATKSYMAGTFVLRNSSRQGLIGQLEFLELHGLPETYLTNFVQRVHAVTPEQVKEITAKYVDDTRATIVVVGDRKVVEEQLKGIATVVVDKD